MRYVVLDSKGRHKGQRAFVLGTGPSLLVTQGLSRLQQEVVFVCSRMKLWTGLPFVPTYQVITEPLHVQEIHRWEMEGVRERFLVSNGFLDRKGWSWIPKEPQEHYLVQDGVRGLEESWMPLTNGRSSVLAAVQIALWMGADPIYLAGCETTFKGHAWDPEDVRPRGHGVDTRVVDAFRVAHAGMRNKGRSLVDCTPSGYLSRQGVLPYEALEEVLGV